MEFKFLFAYLLTIESAVGVTARCLKWFFGCRQLVFAWESPANWISARDYHIENLLKSSSNTMKRATSNEERKMKKSLIGILMTTVMLLSIAAPLLAVPAVSAADESDWYMTVNGVLDSDAYSLYPFSTRNSLKIGFSKFGEMINSNENVGLEYGAVDPFAPAAGADIGRITKSAWLNGWLCNITYFHTIRNQLRTVWVSAQHGDPNGVTYGGDWIRVDFPNDRIVNDIEDPTDPGYIIGNYAAGSGNYGGRKTNGTAVTEPIQVFYDGPRSFVALLKTTVYDHFQYGSDSTTEDIPLLEVRFMINFNKVKKEVVVFKELKTLVADKYTDMLKVQFSNRGEVDLGTEDTTYDSYFHFYTEGESQYNPNYNDTVAEGLDTVYDRNWVLNQTESPSDLRWANYSAAGPFPQLSDATYDLAVAVNPDAGMFGYTWWAAFWPSLSDWSIDGWPMWAQSISAWDPHDIDSRTWATVPRTEPAIPFYIGEWDVELKSKGKVTPSGGYDQQMYRFVTVYGVSDRQDGEDADQPMQTTPYPYVFSNKIDSEAKYQLDEVFNPYDLVQAVHQTTRSWVEWTTAAEYTTKHRPVLVVPNNLWNQYNTGAERIIDYNGTFGASLLLRAGLWSQYSIVQNADGTATISGLTAGHTYKILYNTLPDVTVEQSGSDTETMVSTNNTASEPATSAVIAAMTATNTWEDQIDAGHSFSMTIPEITVNVLGDTLMNENWTDSWSVVKNYNEDNFKVFLGETYVATVDMYDPVTVVSSNVTFNFDMGVFTKSVTAPTDTKVIWPNDKSETVHVDYLNHNVTFEIEVTNLYNDEEQDGNQTLTATATVTIDAEYRNYLMGRYDWAVVGRDAESVDSAGAALVTAAFKNKQVEIGMAGSDMMDPVVSNQMPWVMAKMTTGDEWVNYLKTGAGTDPANYRAYLRDDWCKQGTTQNDEWPVATANMIGVGGPLANLLSYYGNDFTQAIFGLSDFTDYAAWENKLVPKTCWDHAKGYTNTNTEGYATVSTYRDINETVLFLIWGNWGRDTFYASRWFHEHLVYQLQEAPAGITSVVIKISYQSTNEGYKPTGFSIVECLGTISERTWKHGSMTKGGIHDP